MAALRTTSENGVRTNVAITAFLDLAPVAATVVTVPAIMTALMDTTAMTARRIVALTVSTQHARGEPAPARMAVLADLKEATAHKVN